MLEALEHGSHVRPLPTLSHSHKSLFNNHRVRVSQQLFQRGSTLNLFLNFSFREFGANVADAGFNELGLVSVRVQEISIEIILQRPSLVVSHFIQEPSGPRLNISVVRRKFSRFDEAFFSFGQFAIILKNSAEVEYKEARLRELLARL